MVNEKNKQYFPSIVGLVIALGSSIALRHILSPILEPLNMSSRVIVQLANKWTITTIILVLILLWERKPLSSIGIRRMTGQDALWAFVGFLLGGAIIMITMPVVNAFGLGSTESGVQRLGELSFGLRVAIVVTAATTEEILYRGYPIERLNAFTKRLILSAMISYVIFVALHISFWGLGGTIQIGLGSVVLYALYTWRRNLLACMLMHFLNNAVAFLLIPTFLPK